MRKKDIFGRIIPGITDVHDRNRFESYLGSKSWAEADLWVSIELCYLRNKVIRQRILYNVFGVLMSFVMAFLTWVALYPSGDPKELEAFPLATTCNNLYLKLCEIVPYEKPAEIIGLILMPFAVCLVIAIIAIILGEIIYKARCEKYRNSNNRGGAATVKRKIEKLGKLHSSYSLEYNGLLFYALFAGIFTGGVMVFKAVPCGFNPFEYLILAVIFDVIYGLVFLGIIYICSLFKEWFGIEGYNDFYWGRTVGWALGEHYSSSSDDDSPSSDTFIMDDETITKILDDVYGSLEGKGRWDY